MEKIYAELLAHITSKGKAKDRSALCSDLLTHTERIMFAKRLAIICMLGEGYSFGAIQEIVRVSPSTVGRIWKAMRRGKYGRIVKILKKRKVSNSIVGILETILILPKPYNAPRWKFIDELTFRDER